MTRLEAALSLAAAGFWIFPLKPGLKTPAHKGWQAEATRDPAQINAWFATGDFNIGIFTGRFQDDAALLVVDVDVRPGKDGNDAIFDLACEGFELRATRTHTTPSGGRHLLYRVPEAVRQGADLLGRGCDIRSRGGLLAGPGSSTKDGTYAVAGGDVVDAPGWLVQRLGARRAERPSIDHRPVGVDSDSAVVRARAFLASAPLAIEGQGGDETTYKIACRLKDMGVDRPTAADLMDQWWNPRCQPPWHIDDLQDKVNNAYAYGENPLGSAAPEAEFKAVAPDLPVSETRDSSEADHPFDELNKEFAHLIVGGGDCILWETTDRRDRKIIKYLPIPTFKRHRKLAAKKFPIGKRMQPLADAWMESEERRSYDEVVFMPALEPPTRFYNLWRGFAVEPWPIDGPLAPPAARAAVDAWVDHIQENVCRGDAELAKWLIGYFAHLVQRPWEKPLVALVFKGQKGTGKNATVERVARLLGPHGLVASNRRYLTSNFNGHLENCLLFILDEAVWAGDKQGEGVLKDLITGTDHVIERKGVEPYTVENRTRVAIIGNEDWLVPASYDERRFAVFTMGLGRRQDNAFFQAMREGMECGGSRLLLGYLQGLPLDGIDLNTAPKTSGLLDQKHATLEPFPAWWLECITEGRIGEFEGWPAIVEVDRFLGSFRRWVRDRRVKYGVPTDNNVLGRKLRVFIPAIGKSTKIKASGPTCYRLPSLSECRAAWDLHIGHIVEWPD